MELQHSTLLFYSFTQISNYEGHGCCNNDRLRTRPPAVIPVFLILCALDQACQDAHLRWASEAYRLLFGKGKVACAQQSFFERAVALQRVVSTDSRNVEGRLKRFLLGLRDAFVVEVIVGEVPSFQVHVPAVKLGLVLFLCRVGSKGFGTEFPFVSIADNRGGLSLCVLKDLVLAFVTYTLFDFLLIPINHLLSHHLCHLFYLGRHGHHDHSSRPDLHHILNLLYVMSVVLFLIDHQCVNFFSYDTHLYYQNTCSPLTSLRM